MNQSNQLVWFMGLKGSDSIMEDGVLGAEKRKTRWRGGHM